MVASDVVFGEVGVRFLDVMDVLCFVGAGGSSILVRDLGYVPAHWEYTGIITPEGDPQTDRA